MKTLVVLECERYIQPFMRAMLTVAQKHYDKIVIITNPLTKGESIKTDKIEHVEVPKDIRRKSIILAPLSMFSSDVISQIFKALRYNRFNRKFIGALTLYACYGMAFCRTAVPYLKDALQNGDVHILSCWFSVEAWTAGKLKKEFPQVKAYSLAHSFEIDPLKNDFVDLTFNQWKHKYLDRIFFISRKMRDIYNDATHHKYVEKYSSQMAVQYLGCIKHFEGLNPLRDRQKIRIMSCSYVRPEKRIDLIMNSLEEWTLCPLEWVHMGNGPLLESMRQRAKTLMVNNKNVTIDFKGYVSNEYVHKYYREKQVDIFINLSSSEGVPVSIMEAIAYGISVVATDVGGVSEIIDDKHGLLVASNASSNLIRKELEDFVRRYQQNALPMRSSAYNFWKMHFDAKRNYDEFFNQMS